MKLSKNRFLHNQNRLFAFYLSIMFMVMFSVACANESRELSKSRGSDMLGPQTGLVPSRLQSYVDTNDCTSPIQSSPYVIILGNGGANMRLSCPVNRPVMYGWHQQLGFGGFGAIQHGGGNSWIICCAVGHKWVPITTNN